MYLCLDQYMQLRFLLGMRGKHIQTDEVHVLISAKKAWQNMLKDCHFKQHTVEKCGGPFTFSII